MDTRLYFVLGDLVGNVLIGVVAGWLCALIIGPGWPMLPAMLVGMLLGMALSLLLFVPLGILFGAMEVMVPIMFSGMLSGMVVGMWAAMAPLPVTAAVVVGGICGLIGINVIWILNNSLRGRRDTVQGG